MASKTPMPPRGDPYATGAFDGEHISDRCYTDGCDESPAGWCRTCERSHGFGEAEGEARALCIAHLAAHCVEHQHAAWINAVPELKVYLDDQQGMLLDALEALDSIRAEMHGLDELRARGLLSMPQQDVALLAALDESRDEIADMCDEIYAVGHVLRTRYDAPTPSPRKLETGGEGDDE